MKKFAKKTIFRSLASACVLGTSCGSAVLCGQQLLPKAPSPAQTLPPVVSGTQAANLGLPPIISGGQNGIQSANPGLPPIVPRSATSNNVPPVVSGTELLQQDVPSAGLPAAGLPSAVKGQNFPTDGERRIAEFIRANAANVQAVANTGYAPQENSPSDQQGLPAAPSIVPVPVPNLVPPPMAQPQSTPSIGGQGYASPGEYSVMEQPTQSYQQVQPNYQPAHVPQVENMQPGSVDYFQPGSGAVDSYSEGQNVDYGALDSTFDCCGFVCDSRNYLIIDALYWEREDGVFRASNIFNIDDLDHSWGGRVTWGTKRDSTRGIEYSYMQLDPLLAVSTQTDGGTLFGALFGNATTGNLPANAFTAFRNGTYAQQFHKSELRSAEINRTWWGSDVAKAFIGARYINFEDEFRLSMANTAGQQGYHLIDTSNNMFGLHVGGEILYDIGYRLSFSFGGKLGGYANFNEGNLTHINNGAVRAFGSDSDTDFAWSGEVGTWARYKLTPNVRLRLGYEIFGLFDVKDVESAFNPIVQSTTGRSSPNGDATFHGPSFGFEIYR